MQPIIVLMAGGIGAGKDTFADFLTEGYGFTKLAFADPLKEAVSSLFNFPCHWCYDRRTKEKRPTLGNGMTVGEILQKFGTEVGRQINPRMWAELAEMRIKALGLSRVAITDCRFENEAKFFLEKYTTAHVIYLTRRAGDLQGSRDPGHISENQTWARRMCDCDTPRMHKIDNQNMTVKEAEAAMMTIMTGILADARATGVFDGDMW